MGCHTSGIFYGAALYADDLMLLASSRRYLQKMLTLCGEYAKEHNLVFSTDPDPGQPHGSIDFFIQKT